MRVPIDVREFAAYWAVIRSAAMQRLNTTQTWAKIRQWEAQRGITRPTNIAIGISKLRSLATQARTASERLAKAGPDTVLGPQHISSEINARPLNEQVVSPKYIARFKATVARPTGTDERWLSYVYRGQLPTTKGELLRHLTMISPQIGAGSDEVILGLTGEIQLVAQ